MHALAGQSVFGVGSNQDYKTAFFGSAVDPTGDVKFILDPSGDGLVNNQDIQAEINLVATANPGPGAVPGLSVVPEPSSMTLGLLGALAGLALLRKRRPVAVL